MSLEIRLKYEQIQTEEKETLTINEQLIKELVSDSLQVSKIIELCEQSNHSMEIERKMIMLIPDDVSSLDVLANMNPVSYTHLTLPTKQTACRSRWSPYH